jgi:hypothetical protein
MRDLYVHWLVVGHMDLFVDGHGHMFCRFNVLAHLMGVSVNMNGSFFSMSAMTFIASERATA